MAHRESQDSVDGSNRRRHLGHTVSARLETRTMELTVSGKTSANETQASQGSQTQCEGTCVRSALVQNYDSARDESDASNPIGSDLYLARLKPG